LLPQLKNPDMNPTGDQKTRPISPKQNRTPAFSATIVPESKFTQILKAAHDHQRPDEIVSATEVLVKSGDVPKSKIGRAKDRANRALSESSHNNDRLTY